MFKLEEYEHEASDNADYLRNAGLKVDIRTFTDCQIELFHHLEGEMSEIKEEIDEKRFGRYAPHMDAFRKVLAEGATAEDYSDKLELDPQVYEKMNIVRNTCAFYPWET